MMYNQILDEPYSTKRKQIVKYPIFVHINAKKINNIIFIRNFMTSLLDLYFENEKKTNLQVQHPFNKEKVLMQSLCLSTPQKYGKEMIKINESTSCITLRSENSLSNITYFTVIQNKTNNLDVLIMPYDSYGSMIRSKENFNKNGWIRKHINQNKNRFLKVNPVTGETYFKYSCFKSNSIEVSTFWEELLDCVMTIQEEMPMLLTKIINLEAKDKPINFPDQAIETSKLVTSIKLAELIKQNQNLDEILYNLKVRNKTPNHKRISAQEYEKSLKFFVESNKIKNFESCTSRETLSSIKEDYHSFSKSLESNTFSFKKSNLIPLTLNEDEEKAIKTKLYSEHSLGECRHKIKQFNREICLHVKSSEYQKTQKIKKVLSSLSLDVQYLFLDSYFEQNSFQKVIITLALLQTPLNTYLVRNFISISHETKFRLLIQVINAVFTLWTKSQVYFHRLDISVFSVVKSLKVKLKDLSSAEHINLQRIESSENLIFYQMQRKVMKQLSEIYFEIFFNKDPILKKYKCQDDGLVALYRQNHLMFESLNSLTKFYFPNNLFSLIIGLNYFFIERYFDFLKERLKLEPENPQKNSENIRRAKDGTVRIDLILTMIQQFLEEDLARKELESLKDQQMEREKEKLKQ